MMALRSVISSKIPMVIILGATGTGKTKLSVELAQNLKRRSSARILCRCAKPFDTQFFFQIYKGLDIVTAKATSQERQLVPHHLLDILEPHQMFTVVDFRNRALKLIQNLTERGKIPIIVGGTNYYIESIVYKILVENMDDPEALLWEKSKRKRDYYDDSNEPDRKKAGFPSIRDKEDSETSKYETMDNIEKNDSDNDKSETIPSSDGSKNFEKTDLDITSVHFKEKLKENVDNEAKFTNDEIHTMLKNIDPVMASRLHPNNRRKVLRSIEHWLKTGRRHSEVLDEQKLIEGQLRRPNATVILWLKCEQTVHDQRLNQRVDSMLEQGLIEELLDFHDRHNKQRIKDGKVPDYTKGVFQTLGFKEFHEYLMLPSEQRNSEEGKKLLHESIEIMKMTTRRYARRQNKMVKGRFIDIVTREVPPIYELDTTDLSKWDDAVKSKAIEIIESYLNDVPCPHEPLKRFLDEKKQNINGHSCNFCEVCERLIIGDKEFAIHLNSNRHMRVIKRKTSFWTNIRKIKNKRTKMDS